RIAAAQAQLHLAQAQRIRVLARRDADDPLEVALQVIRAAADAPGEHRERRVPLHFGQVHARAPDFLHPWIRRSRFARLAPEAGTKAGALGLGKFVEETYDLAPRPAARARRPAINAGGTNGVDELAVGAAVANDHGSPARIVGRARGLSLCHGNHADTMPRRGEAPLSASCGQTRQLSKPTAVLRSAAGCGSRSSAAAASAAISAGAWPSPAPMS